MSNDFSHITILGSGLLGGSLALALEQLPDPPQVTLWGRNPESATTANLLGIRHATADFTAAVKGADLLILTVPVGAMPDLLDRAILAGLPSSCLITDVGSVKQTPHRTLRTILEKSGNPFIGSHPMAGSERNGIAAATANLFDQAACLLTNDDQVSPTLAAALDRFWQSVGCRTTWLSAANHDALVARISHLPHVVAAATAQIALATPDDGRFGGGGLRDTTRIASGNPQMWAEILTENREALAAPLRQTIAELTTILALIDDNSPAALHDWLATAKGLRDTLNPPI